MVPEQKLFTHMRLQKKSELIFLPQVFPAYQLLLPLRRITKNTCVRSKIRKQKLPPYVLPRMTVSQSGRIKPYIFTFSEPIHDDSDCCS